MMLGKMRQVFHRFRGRPIEFDLSPYQKTLDQVERQITLFHMDRC